MKTLRRHKHDTAPHSVNLVDQVPAVVGHQRLHQAHLPLERIAHCLQQRLHARPSQPAHWHRRRACSSHGRHKRRVLALIHFVPHVQAGHVVHPQFRQHRVHGFCLGSCVGTAHVHHVQQQRGVGNFLQGGTEGSHQLRRQLLNKPYTFS